MLKPKMYSAKTIAINISQPVPERNLLGVTPETMRQAHDLICRKAVGTYRIISFDGGGVRGIIQAVWLKELSKRLKQVEDKPLSDYFDLIAGTSVGSILACAVALDLDMENVIQLFLTRGREIFPSFWRMALGKILRIPSEGLSNPIYDAKKGLEPVLQQEIGDIPFTDLSKLVFVTGYSTTDSSPKFFRSDQPDKFGRNLAWQIVRASCAVPAYFSAGPIHINGARHLTIDGGVFGSNPSDCALAEAIKINRQNGNLPTNYVVASFGTGLIKDKIPARVALRGGALEWVWHIIDTIFNSITESTDHKVQQIVGEGNLFRFQARLPRGATRLDNADPDNLRVLMQTAEDFIHSPDGNKLFDDLVEVLTTP